MTEKESGVYSPPPDEYDRFDVGEEDDSRRGPLLLVVAVAVLIALVAVVYTAYNQGIRTGGRDEAPLIAAPTSPIKTKPETRDQQPETGSQNAAYEAIDGSGQSEGVVVTPPPQQPVAREPAPVIAAKPAPQKQAPKPVVTAKPNPVSSFVVQTDGKFVVQLGAFRSEDQALATWRKVRNRLPAIMDGTASDVQRADLGAKGVYYRLRAAAFADRAMANGFCAALKTKGQDCIVVAR